MYRIKMSGSNFLDHIFQELGSYPGSQMAYKIDFVVCEWLFEKLKEIDFRIATDEWLRKHYGNLVRLRYLLENEVEESKFVVLYDSKIGFQLLKELRVERFPEA